MVCVPARRAHEADMDRGRPLGLAAAAAASGWGDRRAGASKTTLAQAIAIALREVPGEALSAEIVLEDGDAVIEVTVYTGGGCSTSRWTATRAGRIVDEEESRLEGRRPRPTDGPAPIFRAIHQNETRGCVVSCRCRHAPAPRHPRLHAPAFSALASAGLARAAEERPRIEPIRARRPPSTARLDDEAWQGAAPPPHRVADATTP